MTARNYYHVGILVNDIHAARERFAAVTGLRFTPVQVVPLKHFRDAHGDHELSLTLCYSVEGPPFLELIQADPAGGVFGTHQGDGVHHVGFHEEDVAGRVRELESRHGLGLEAARFGNRDATRMAAAYVDPGGLFGVRLELVDEQGRAALYDWLGSFSEGGSG